jgi:hypothetical protein
MKDDTGGSLVITVSFPLLAQGTPGHRSILGSNKDKIKRLHPATQTILSILRSDWEFLDAYMDGMKRMFEHNQIPKDSPKSFFPTQLTLEEVYSRVHGSPFMQLLMQNQRDIRENPKRPKECRIDQLSEEILVDKIAPFLRSASLHALRSTCSYLYTVLQAVVPGMKLQLYSHQIKSLSWMRTREAEHLVETDLCDLSPTSPHAVAGDAHRAATGGLTTKLVPRPRETSSACAIRINQLTGNEVGCANVSDLDRTVARGGLLCDDPGLGKVRARSGLLCCLVIV